MREVDALRRGPDDWFDAYLFDLDGTVYLGDELLPGARDLLDGLRDRGARRVFLSNNPTRDPEMYLDKLTHLGIAAEPDEIVNTVVSTVAWLKAQHPGAVVFPIAEAPLVRALAAAGIAGPITSEIAAASDYDQLFYYGENYHQQYLAKPGARPYCSAQPRCVSLPAFESWCPPGLEHHAPKLPEAFWAQHGPKPHCVINSPDEPIVWMA